jgi:valyl-tRNA synthetase
MDKKTKRRYTEREFRDGVRQLTAAQKRKLLQQLRRLGRPQT